MRYNDNNPKIIHDRWEGYEVQAKYGVNVKLGEILRNQQIL